MQGGRRRERRSKQLLNDLKKMRKNWNYKEKQWIAICGELLMEEVKHLT